MQTWFDAQHDQKILDGIYAWSSWLSLGSNTKGGLPLFFVLVTAVNIEAAIEAVEAAEATVSLLQFLLELMHLQLMQTSSTLDVL